MDNEASIAFLDKPVDQRVVMNEHNGPPLRSQVVYNPQHVAGLVTQPAALSDPNCQGSIINHKNVLYVSNLNTTGSVRTDLTLKNSSDNGASWSNGIQVWEGAAGYSQLVPLDDSTKLGLVFE